MDLNLLFNPITCCCIFYNGLTVNTSRVTGGLSSCRSGRLLRKANSYSHLKWFFVYLANACPMLFSYSTSSLPVVQRDIVRQVENVRAGEQVSAIHVGWQAERTDTVISHANAMKVGLQIVVSSGRTETRDSCGSLKIY